MIKLFAILILFSGLLLSCSKHDTNTAFTKVRIRIENATGFTLGDASIGNTNYGDIIAGQLTDYKIINEPVYAGYCSFQLDSIQSGAGVGVCGSPLPPPFVVGSYTFKVIPAVGYNTVSVTKQ